MQKIKNLKVVPNVIFSHGAISELPQIVSEKCGDSGYAIYVIDHYFKGNGFQDSLKLKQDDLCFYLDTTDEPTTTQVDEYVRKIMTSRHRTPDAFDGKTVT
ncbi:hypothetical protein GF337_20040 [candidate division KSB1 bacterium]|nr:hypothetical protein [candidate division KSB1 bacterium]